MFLEHFGVREDPFGVTPDPRFLYLSEKHHAALERLQGGIEGNRGFLALIAPPGLGKTTLLYHMLAQSRETQSAETAFVFQTQCNSRELLRQIVADLGIETDDEDVLRNQQRLREFLAREANAGRFVIVFIDEAQNLSADALEAVRLLTNFETPKSKLLQIVLAGQPALASRLSDPALAQLKQRLFGMIYLGRLSDAETRAYIAHRLHVAGYTGSRLFSQEAETLICTRSEGIPRTINAVCYASLEIAYRRRERVIKESIVQDALDVIAPELPSNERAEYEATPARATAAMSSASSTLGAVRSKAPESNAAPKLAMLEPSNAVGAVVRSGTGSAAAKALQGAPAMVRSRAVTARPVQRKFSIDEHKFLLGLLAVGTGVLGAALATAGFERWQNMDAVVREEDIPIVHAAVSPPPAPVSAALSAQNSVTGKKLRRSSRSEAPDTSRIFPAEGKSTAIGAEFIAAKSVTPSLPSSDEAVVSAHSMISPIISPLAAESPSELMSSINPEYPKAAVAAGLEGTVMIKATIGSDGKVKRPELISGDPILAQAAIRTVLDWRYRPASVNGHPVESQAQIVFRFSLAKPAR